MGMDRRTVWLGCLLGAWVGLGAACGHDWSAAGDDAGAGEAEVSDGDVEDEVGADLPDVAEVEAVSDGDADELVSHDTPPDVRPDTGPRACGNGVVEPGEVCDDGNTVTEWCEDDNSEACLSDCSLLSATCGNGRLDPGEMCDDGDPDSFDECTTSCTMNDLGIGAPCRCIEGCAELDFSAGAIVGCEFVDAPPDEVANVACLRGLRNPLLPLEVYAAEGYCTWMAIGCESAAMICSTVPQFGDVERFECPAGYVERSIVWAAMDTVITVAYCAKPCASQRDCRWNAVEEEGSPWAGQCGQWTCISTGDGSESFCDDPRNTWD
ncbi:MAG: hypothetical protein JXB32_02975 [Deltaproteobacteria bacterium]|nr:hypothetical protein [Deltaproteobacteria bacterium]